MYRNNDAQRGGGISFDQILSLNLSQTANDYNPMEEIITYYTEDSFEIQYDFENISFVNNSADTGGALHYADSLPTPPAIGKFSSFVGNSANLGGAIHFTYFSRPKVCISSYSPFVPKLTLSLFRKHLFLMLNLKTSENSQYYFIYLLFIQEISWATVGGSNIGFSAIPNTNEASLFCSNCSFPNDFTSGYQNEMGFATRRIFYFLQRNWIYSDRHIKRLWHLILLMKGCVQVLFIFIPIPIYLFLLSLKINSIQQ